MKRLTVLVLLFFPTFSDAGNYDPCEAVLARGVFNSKEMFTDYRAQSDFKEFMCSNAYLENKEEIDNLICKSDSSSSETTWDSGANYLNLITGSGNAKIHKDFRNKYCSSENRFNYSSWSAAHCQSTYAYSNTKSITHTLIKRASPEILNAWKDCKYKNNKSTDLICYGEEFGELLSFSIEWDHRYASTLTVASFQHPNLKLLGNPPNEIYRGNAKFAFERKDKKKHSLIQISAVEAVDGQKTTISCEYSIPPARCEKVVYRKGLSKICGIEKYVKGKGKVCGVLKYVRKRDKACGVERY